MAARRGRSAPARKRAAAGARPRTGQRGASPLRARPPRTVRGGDPLGRLRAICLALPDADEKLSHGEPTWFAGKGKVFAMFDDHHHGAPHVSVWVPAPPGLQEALIEREPARYWRPPYLGHRGWVAIILDTGPDWGVVAGLIEQAYRMVASPKLVARLPAPSE